MKESVYKSFVSGDPHEEELLRQLIRGDIAGYEVLFHKYYPTFFAFIKGMTKETAVAEDIAQNIFMKVWLNREKLDAANPSATTFSCWPNTRYTTTSAPRAARSRP